MCFLLDAPFFTSTVAPAPAPATIVPGVVTTSAIGAATTVINTASVAPITVPGVVTQTASPITTVTNPNATLTTTPRPTTTTLAPNCTTETTNNIYLISPDGFLYQFTPATIKFTLVGPLNCPSNSTSYSISLQRNGILWVLVDDGRLYTYNIQTAQCTITAFVRNQTDIFQFTMSFVKNDNDAGEVLYISKNNDNGGVLATIDLNSLNVSKVGNYNDGSFADIGGTNDGKLFGLFADSLFIIKQINKTNAQILSQYPLPEPSYTDSTHYAFAPYGSKFFYFLGTGDSTDIHYFDTTTNISSLVETVPIIVFSATTSGCLDTSKPVPLPKTDCIPETEGYTYLIDRNNVLHKFSPTTLQVTEVAIVNCSETSSVYSIALQRNGLLWVLFGDGDLYTFNLTDQTCVDKGFLPNQTDISYFTMAFVKNVGDNNETLFISKFNDGGGVLAEIDTNTLTVVKVGNYSDGGGIASLTGSNDGKLLSFFYDNSLIFKEIDGSNAQILSKYPLAEPFDGNPSNYDFASYEKNFIYFHTSENSTYIHLFNTTANTSTLLNTVPLILSDASTSTCLDTSLPIIPPLTDCTVETEDYIYLVDLDNILYKFSPTTFQVTVVGPLNCSETSSVFSIALQRNGLLWVLFYDGDLYTFNVTDQTCINTGFGRNQTGILDFSMAFVKNVGDNKETLFISKLYNGGGVLAKIDTNTLNIVEIGNYSDGAEFATLTGSNDGRLFGLFFDNPPTIKEVDDTDAQILSAYPLSEPFDGFVYLYSFASYENKFFYFLKSENSTYIHLFDPKTNRSTLLNTVPFSFFNAATSTCLDTSAPIILPKTDCIQKTEDYIYLVDEVEVLYKFSPSTLQVTEVATINCSETSHLSSISLQRNGLLWVLFGDGDLYTFNLTDQTCINTGFVRNQTDISDFTMTFVKNVGDNNETLFISKSNDGGGVLAKIDTNTLTVSKIGNYSDGGGIASLGGSNDGKLFSFFYDNSLIFKEIDYSNAQILSEYQLEQPFQGNSYNYEFASYGKKFIYFHTSENSSYIRLFDTTTNTSTLLTTVPFRFYDAATSTCLDTSVPIPLPKTNCIPETEDYIYLVDTDNILYKFDTATLILTEVAPIICSDSSSVFSIALAQNGILVVLFDDGKLYTFDIIDKSCFDTGFVQNQSDISYFTMAFVKNSNGIDETLFITKFSGDGGVLATIDGSTLKTTVVGNYDNGSLAVLTGSNNGRLFGLFFESPLKIKEIDDTNAQTLSEYTLDFPFDEVTGFYTFASYGNKFFVFHSDANTTDIHLFDPKTEKSSLLKVLPYKFLDGATSTCFDKTDFMPKPVTDCSAEADENIYIIDIYNNLYELDSRTFAFTNLTTIDCSVNESVFSMAVQRSGLLWLQLNDGKLYKYNITTKTCTDSGFIRNQTDIEYFSMTFVQKDIGGDELLYISKINDDGGKLASIDLDTLTVSYIGNYSEGQYGSIRGASNGRLFGLSSDSDDDESLNIRAIDPATAQILFEYPSLPLVNGLDSFSFIPYNSQFFIAGDFSNTLDISIFDPFKNTTTLKTTLSKISIQVFTASNCLGT